jgi:hypothetical protein
MLEPTELRALIKSTLSPLNLYSAAAEELLMATCAQESGLGTYRRQLSGPAIGIFQMEPETFNDIWTNYLAYHTTLAAEVTALATTSPPRPVELATNDPFAIAMCRVHYLRAPGALPAATDLAGLWSYYKAHYNTPLGAATQQQFYANYHKLVQGAAR